MNVVKKGNFFICDKNYTLVADLILDLFGLRVRDEEIFTELIEDEKRENVSEMKIKHLRYAYIYEFPYIELTKYVKEDAWNKVKRWIENRKNTNNPNTRHLHISSQHNVLPLHVEHNQRSSHRQHLLHLTRNTLRKNNGGI